jgi:Integrase core domain
MAPSTMSAILARIGMGKLGRVGLEPAQRYERERPGELVHIDIKKLGRIERGAGARIVGMANRASGPRRKDAAGVSRELAGWEYVHVAVDDCTRLAYAEVLHNHKAPTVVAFLRRAVQFFAQHGVTVERVLTDNGSSYCGTIHALACRALGNPPSAHPPLPTPNQRQGRAVHPHPPRRLGVRRRLPRLSRAHRRPRRLALVLQPPTTTLSPQPQAPDRAPQRASGPTFVGLTHIASG